MDGPRGTVVLRTKPSTKWPDWNWTDYAASSLTVNGRIVCLVGRRGRLTPDLALVPGTMDGLEWTHGRLLAELNWCFFRLGVGVSAVGGDR